jgi:predicted dehydrogenase
MGGELLFEGGRRGHFECGFDRALTQYLEIAGTEGTLRLDDFVIPAAEAQSEYVQTRLHGLRDIDTWDGTQRELKVVHMPAPQEVHMWEAFAACARAGAPDPEWPRQAALTQKVLCAVLDSARRGCAAVAFEA